MRIWRTARLARLAAVLAPAIVLAGCYQPSRLLTVTSNPDILEGQRTRVTIAIQNVLPQAIIPVSITLYERIDPTEQLATRRILADREFLAPLQAAKVRHLTTLGRVEADQVRDAGIWRRVPDTRFLHPRILLPGQSVAETFEFQAVERHRRSLRCDLYYFRLDSDELRGRLYVRDTSLTRRRDDDHHTDVFVSADPGSLADADPRPANYLLYRRRIPSPQATSIVSKPVPLRVRPRAFSHRQAATRARFAPRAHLYFSPANAWAFDYDTGTWLVGPTATVKLTGRYIALLADLERAAAPTIVLTAPRRDGDKLLRLFQESGYADPKDTAKTARATIPTDRLIGVLQRAEALGYLIDGTTWRPLPKAP